MCDLTDAVAIATNRLAVECEAALILAWFVAGAAMLLLTPVAAVLILTGTVLVGGGMIHFRRQWYQSHAFSKLLARGPRI